MVEGGAPPRVYIDTNIFIGAFETPSDYAETLRKVFDVLRRKIGTGVTSELTLAELTIGDSTARPLYMNLLVQNAFIELRPISRHILLGTGAYCDAVGRKVKLADAIHGATAVEAGCRYVLTADKRFPVPTPMMRIHPDETGIGILRGALRA